MIVSKAIDNDTKPSAYQLLTLNCLQCVKLLGLMAVENEEPRPVLRPVDENKDGPRPSAEVEATASPTAHGHHDQWTVAAAEPFPPRPD